MDKLPYSATTLRGLKTAALLNGDREALSKIRKYETEIKLYFKLASEEIILNENGQPVLPEESIFVLLDGFRSADGTIIQPVPGELWKQIERADGTVLVQEVNSVEEFAAPKLDAPVKVSGEYKEINGVRFLQCGPDLCFISADSLTSHQLAEYIAITENIRREDED